MFLRTCLVCLLLLAPIASAQPGRDIFAAQCRVCHGDGHGTERGPNLANNRRVRSQTRAQLLAVIRDGIPASGMPAFNLPDAELQAVGDFVRSLSAPAIESDVSGDPSAGEQFFFGNGRCSNCHMAFGRGRAVGPDLSSIGRQLTVAEIRQAITSPSDSVREGYTVARLRVGAETIRGFVRNESRYNIQLQSFDGRFHLLAAGEYEELSREAGSPMPPTQCDPQQCEDLVAYLSTLGGVSLETEPLPFPSVGGPSAEDIEHPKPGDWPGYHGSQSGNRHSELDQINAENVSDLALQWVFPVNHFVLELTPVVVDGVMYVTGPNQVFALDARAGRTIWHYQRPRSQQVRGDPAKGTNRGVAVLGDRVFMVTDNARLLALHRLTGELLWESDLTEGLSKNNYGNTSAPLVVKDMVVAGISGGDLGVRGFLSAFRADTGAMAWRFWTVPAPGEPLSETWRGTALEQFGGGGGTWMTGTYDSETDTLFWGVGNPYPSMNGDERLGDNLYTDSVLALEPDSGDLKWYYQFTPHDLYDWDGGQTPMILNARYRGQDRRLLLQANRNGFFYVFDRTNGELLLAEPFVDKLTWATGVGDDGRPVLVPGMEPAHDGTKVCPNVLGAANWPSVSFSPETQLFYVQAREACGVYVKPPRWNPRPIPLEPGRMFLRALNIETAERVWELPQVGTADSWGGVLSTSGGVVFFGEDSGAFAAADAETGEELWHVQTNASTALGDGHSWRASPMTYMAGGKQYVAVANGPNILVFGLP